VLRELSEDVAAAVAQVQRERRKKRPSRLRGERKLPFTE